MLTVRHILPDGYETIAEATHVFVVPHAMRGEPLKDVGRVVQVGRVDGRLDEVSDGKLYVMNENGKTIANFEWEITPP